MSFNSYKGIITVGLAANRPATPDGPEFNQFFLASDTVVLSLWKAAPTQANPSAGAWATVGAGVVNDPTPKTVATLPASPATGQFANVTDATVSTVGTTVVGGGATKVLVQWDGAAWKIVAA